MFEKPRLYAVLGITLVIQAISCFVIFCATLSEKKSLASACWALFVSFGTAGAVLLSVYKKEEDKRVRRMKKRLARHDHWLHTFEYPACAEPSLNVYKKREPKEEI